MRKRLRLLIKFFASLQFLNHMVSLTDIHNRSLHFHRPAIFKTYHTPGPEYLLLILREIPIFAIIVAVSAYGFIEAVLNALTVCSVHSSNEVLQPGILLKFKNLVKLW